MSTSPAQIPIVRTPRPNPPRRLRPWKVLSAAVSCVALVSLSGNSAGAGDPSAYDPPEVYENPECDPRVSSNVPEGCEEHRPSPVVVHRWEIHERMAPEVQALFADRFGGMWGSGREIPAEQHVTYFGAVKPTSEEKARFDVLREGDDSFRLVSTARSLRELQVIRDQAMAEAIRLGGDRQPQVITAQIHPELQKVVLDAKYFEPEWVAELESLFPSGVLEVRVLSYLTMELDHTTRTQYPPYEGGLGLTIVPR